MEYALEHDMPYFTEEGHGFRTVREAVEAQGRRDRDRGGPGPVSVTVSGNQPPYAGGSSGSSTPSSVASPSRVQSPLRTPAGNELDLDDLKERMKDLESVVHGPGVSRPAFASPPGLLSPISSRLVTPEPIPVDGLGLKQPEEPDHAAQEQAAEEQAQSPESSDPNAGNGSSQPHVNSPLPKQRRPNPDSSNTTSI